jgi:hypothetical protein
MGGTGTKVSVDTLVCSAAGFAPTKSARYFDGLAQMIAEAICTTRGG